MRKTEAIDSSYCINVEFDGILKQYRVIFGWSVRGRGVQFEVWHIVVGLDVDDLISLSITDLKLLTLSDKRMPLLLPSTKVCYVNREETKLSWVKKDKI